MLEIGLRTPPLVIGPIIGGGAAADLFGFPINVIAVIRRVAREILAPLTQGVQFSHGVLESARLNVTRTTSVQACRDPLGAAVRLLEHLSGGSAQGIGFHESEEILHAPTPDSEAGRSVEQKFRHVCRRIDPVVASQFGTKRLICLLICLQVRRGCAAPDVDRRFSQRASISTRFAKSRA